ncbi:MAG: PIN domain-containing protein [Terracidiphilus sp.]
MLDSSVVIAAERKGESVAAFLRRIQGLTGDQRVVLSAVGLTELIHALYRTSDPLIRRNRKWFLDDPMAAAEAVPYTKSTALLAGRIDGEQRSLGITIPSIDLLIGATALEIGYTLVTANPRHFHMIPGLQVVSL